MLPEIKKNTEQLRVQMESMTELNKKLEAENHGLKGSLGNKVKHFEQLNNTLQAEKEQAMADLEALKTKNNELMGTVASLGESLNIRTQEAIMKTEAFDDQAKKLESMTEKLNDQNNLINQMKEFNSSLTSDLDSVKNELKTANSEKD